MSTISGMGCSMNMMTQIMTMQQPDKQQMFKNIDADASGLVEQTELSSFVEQFASNMGIEINAEDALTSYNANADGGLSQEEMESMLSACMPAPPDMSAVSGSFGGGGMTGVQCLRRHLLHRMQRKCSAILIRTAVGQSMKVN